MPSESIVAQAMPPSDPRTPEDRRAAGRAARQQVPRASHGSWSPHPDRRDPVTLLAEQNQSRVQWLVPVRHARMRVSPFTFYRGAARLMAADLSSTPNAGLRVQLGGDAHLSNFGAYASPERNLVLDANDFDETLPGPFEWDVKRMATSFMIAAQHLGFDQAIADSVTERSVRSYRRAMARFAGLGYLDLMYERTTVDTLAPSAGLTATELSARRAAFIKRARSRTSLQALKKLAYEVDGRFLIRNHYPLLVPIRHFPSEVDPQVLLAGLDRGLAQYRETLNSDRRAFLERYRAVDMALKVVGVGSVGTRCYVVLLQGRDANDPLFLQIKEANKSVLSEFLGDSAYANQGQRVVVGQRLVQAETDPFLGWAQGLEGRDFYVRQLRDWKGSAEAEGATPAQLGFYATICGAILARGHARSGDAIAISGYLGSGTTFDAALVSFARAYSRQNQADYSAFTAAIDSGRLPVADAVTAGLADA